MYMYICVGSRPRCVPTHLFLLGRKSLARSIDQQINTHSIFSTKNKKWPIDPRFLSALEFTDDIGARDHGLLRLHMLISTGLEIGGQISQLMGSMAGMVIEVLLIAHHILAIVHQNLQVTLLALILAEAHHAAAPHFHRAHAFGQSESGRSQHLTIPRSFGQRDTMAPCVTR